jgi:hypothetical protein
MRAVLAAVALVGACDHGPPPLDDCGGDLRGVWRAAETGIRWQAHLGRTAWELYPLDDERPAGRVSAPAAIDLPRVPAGASEILGTMTRRFEDGAQLCPVAVPARLHTCRGDRAQLDVAPPSAPTSFAPCTAAPGAPVTWTLTRSR